MKSVTTTDLTREGTLLHPILSQCYHDYQQGVLTDYDMVGIYLLLFLATRRPRKWSAGPLKEKVCLYDGNSPVASVLVCQYPEVAEVVDLAYLAKTMKRSVDTITVIDIFDSLRFTGIKDNGDNYVNRCMVLWAYGKRPVKLLTYIPTPSEVLRQQARRERVVTIFTTLEELCRMHTSKLTYMEGMPEHNRDPLEFTIHDLKHMEHYMDEKISSEQGHDLRLWHELEYVMADMNCYSTHLLRYLYAKVHNSCLRNEIAIRTYLQENGELLDEESSPEELLRVVWTRIINAMGMTSDDEDPLIRKAFHAAMLLIDVSHLRLSALTEDDWEAVRDYFKSKV
eukprot:scaffold559_cov176-Ochromonas_danica.AAC.1